MLKCNCGCWDSICSWITTQKKEEEKTKKEIKNEINLI